MYRYLIGYSCILILLTIFYLKKPHYLKLILVLSYGLIYLLYCIYMMNNLVFDYIHLIIVLVTIALLFFFYKTNKIDKNKSLN